MYTSFSKVPLHTAVAAAVADDDDDDGYYDDYYNDYYGTYTLKVQNSILPGGGGGALI